MKGKSEFVLHAEAATHVLISMEFSVEVVGFYGNLIEDANILQRNMHPHERNRHE